MAHPLWAVRETVYGTKQVTDAYLLGLAVRNGLVLTTFDKEIAYLAGSEYRKHLLLLGSGE